MSDKDKTLFTDFELTTIEEKDSPACLVVIKGENIGFRHKIAGSVISIGRDPVNDLMLDDSKSSREHAVIEFHSDAVMIRDLDSTNGTSLNRRKLHGDTSTLRNGDLIRIGSTVLKFLTGGNLESLYHDTMYQLAKTDPLTEIPNKKHLLESLEREFSRSRRYDRPLTVIMLDIDFFKRTNDTFGHQAGDEVLKTLAKLIQGRIRRDELLARYGGEEFTLVLPETDLEKALQLAEQIRALTAKHDFQYEEQSIPVTISLGAAQLSAEMQDPGALIGPPTPNCTRPRRAVATRCVVSPPSLAPIA